MKPDRLKILPVITEAEVNQLPSSFFELEKLSVHEVLEYYHAVRDQINNPKNTVSVQLALKQLETNLIWHIQTLVLALDSQVKYLEKEVLRLEKENDRLQEERMKSIERV